MTYETEHARIGTFFDAPLCAGDIAHVDSTIQQLGAALEVPLSSKLTLYWGAEGVETYCTSSESDTTIAGCHLSGRGIAFVTDGSVDHELVHAIGGRVGTMEPFFEEGIAHALGGDPMSDERFQTLPSDLIGLSYAEFERAHGRNTAHHFVHFLIEEQGLGPLNELRRHVRRDAKRPQIVTAFRTVYGAPMEDFEAAWATSAPSNYYVPYLDPPPVDAWQGDELVVRRLVACDDVETHGPLAGIGVPEELHEREGMYTTTTFDILVPGVYDVDLEGESGAARLQKRACWEISSSGTNVFDLDAGGTTQVEMSACRWLATLWIEGSRETDLTLTLRRVGDPT